MVQPVTDPSILAQLNGQSNFVNAMTSGEPAPAGPSTAPGSLDSVLADAQGKPTLNAVNDPTILAQLNGQSPVANDPTNLVSRLGDSLLARSQDATKYANRDSNGQPSALGTLNALGNAAGFVAGDAPMDALSSFAALAPQTRDALKSDIAGTRAGKAFGSALGAIAQGREAFKNAAPVTFNTVGSLANLAPGVGLLGDAEKAAATIAPNKSFVQDLITPKLTPTVRKKLFENSTEEGFLNKRVVQSSPQEQDIISTVSQLPVKSGNSLLKNHNIIEDAKDTEAQNLITHLQKNDVPIADDDILNGLQAAKQRLVNSPFITGDGETAAKKVVIGALDHIMNNPRTASGLLQARKDFDAAVRKEKGDKFFGQEKEGPVNAAVGEVRNMINGLVDSAVPDVAVKESLRKQSNMYRAMEAIQTKGADEAGNRVSRAAKKIGKKIPENKTTAALSALALVGGGAYGINKIGAQ